MTEKVDINIGIFGCVLVGKTTFVNAITQTCATTNETNPSIYKRPIDSDNSAYDIFNHNVIDPNLKINVYDIPGTNDPLNKSQYLDWTKSNISQFDIIIFMTDIICGLCNSDETELLELLLTATKKYGSMMICLINKCDEMFFDEELNDIVFEEKEQEYIYVRANNILSNYASKLDCTSFTPFYPISSENYYIYSSLLKNPEHKLDQKYINKLCKYECGSNQLHKLSRIQKASLCKQVNDQIEVICRSNKIETQTYLETKIRDTGYIGVKCIIQSLIDSNKDNFAYNHLRTKITSLDMDVIDDMQVFMNNVKQCYDDLIQLSTNNTLDDLFWTNIKNSIAKYVISIIKINTNVINDNYTINYCDFELMHYNMQLQCMNFTSLIEQIQNYVGYPKDYMISKQKEIVDKIIMMYDQILSCDNRDNIYTCPSNLLQYLQIIKTYAPSDFDNYTLRILDISCKTNNHFISYQKELKSMILYIIDNYRGTTNSYLTKIAQILHNKQQYIKTNHADEYFPYLIKLKKILKLHIAKSTSINGTAFGPLDILYEVTSSIINRHLSLSYEITNLYNQQHSNYMTETDIDENIDLEIAILARLLR